MPETRSPLITVLGSGLCIPDAALADEWGLAETGTQTDIDASVLPAMMRRRTSSATRVAVSAADRACAAANDDRLSPTIFVSALGEIQITDRLCDAIARQDYPLSPTQFHNSVHNTAASYWSMATGNQAAMQAMSALQDGFALGLLEAWCQLQTSTDKVLLVSYDEAIPERLLADNHWQPCAFALLLARPTRSDARQPLLHRPIQASDPQTTPEEPDSGSADFPLQNPTLAAAPLMRALIRTGIRTAAHAADPPRQTLPLSGGARPWSVDLQWQ